MIEQKSEPSAREVRAALSDWERRIRALFKYVEECVPKEWEVVHGQDLQRTEYLMQSFHIAPKKLPVLTIRNATRELKLTPLELWVVGARGRIDVREGSNHHTLADLGPDAKGKPDWRIVLAFSGGRLLPFDRRQVGRLLSRIQ